MTRRTYYRKVARMYLALSTITVGEGTIIILLVCLFITMLRR